MEAVRAPSAACADVRDHHPRSWREPGTAKGTAQSRGLSARACPVRASGIVVSARSAHLETALGTRAPPGGPCAFRAGEPLFRAGEYEQAEPLYQRALPIWEQALGPAHPETARPLDELENLYPVHGQHAQ